MPMRDDLFKVSVELNKAVIDQDHWRIALQCMADVFGGVFATFELINKRTGQYQQHHDSSAMEVQGNYLDYYMPLNPRIAYGMRPDSPQIIHDYLFISEREMDQNEFYSDFLRPHDLRYFLSFKAYETKEEQGVFTIQKNAKGGLASGEELNALQYIAPMLSNVGTLQAKHAGLLNRMNELEQFFDQFKKGMVIVNEDGYIREANPAALAIFNNNDGVTTSGGKLSCKNLELNTLFNSTRFLQELLSGRYQSQKQFLVARPSGLPPYQVDILPLADSEIGFHQGHSILLFIHDPLTSMNASMSAIADFYGFTIAETKVARAIAAGKTAREIASDFEVTLATVRTQIQGVMQKMNVNRQSEIVRILNGF